MIHSNRKIKFEALVVHSNNDTFNFDNVHD